MYHIGKIAFAIRKFVLEHFMKMYRVEQRYQHRFGIHTFHLMTNNNNRAWLVNISKVYNEVDQVGGFYQCLHTTYVLPELDWALVPSFMQPKNGDFSAFNLQTLFMWMSNYPDMMANYGFRPVCIKTQEEEYINVQKFFSEFLNE